MRPQNLIFQPPCRAFPQESIKAQGDSQQLLLLQQQKLELMALISKLKQENIAIEATKIQQKSIFEGKIQDEKQNLKLVQDNLDETKNQLLNAESEIEKLKFSLENFDQLQLEKTCSQEANCRLFAEKLTLQNENQRLNTLVKQFQNKAKSTEKELKIEKQVALELEKNVEEMEKYVQNKVFEVKNELEAYYEAGKSSFKRRIIELEKQLSEK
ncbi:hypothetical protein SS50377_24476 [Spironucleus salmonicida]|uniref:Uncharacterized protein n=1 Tax=Spironucleus salmonicida TaxID=348837 RepID=V6LMR4_9EUKA|nr:hypothetical protein SS50377_24476 [Spironucleus salmonicida]|eukprot:EST45977.1 Hypothetical protein SS50377_13958 [Spironucleus salmonicida]